MDTILVCYLKYILHLDVYTCRDFDGETSSASSANEAFANYICDQRFVLHFATCVLEQKSKRKPKEKQNQYNNKVRGSFETLAILWLMNDIHWQE